MRKIVAAVLAPVLLVAACSSSGATRVPPTSVPPQSSTQPPSTPAPSTSAPSTPSSTAPATSSTPTTKPVPSAPLRTVTATAPDGTTYVVRVWAQRRDATCYDHAYGRPIVTFLTTHPCRGMQRILATTTLDGRDVGLSIITTSFTSTAKDPYADTSAFRALVEKDGTGSINDLLREGYRLPSGPTSIPSPDAFECLGQDDGVSIYDMWFLDGPTPANDKGLETLAQDIFLQV